MKILIVGAGMTGLALAPLLSSQGHIVQIIEKRSSRGNLSQDAPSVNLTLNAAGREILRELGLLDQVLSLGARLTHRQVHQEGRRAFVQPYGAPDVGWLLSVKRADLHSIMLEEVRKTQIPTLFKTAFVGYNKTKGVAVVSSSGRLTEISCDLTVGADGAFSSVRDDIISGEAVSCTRDFIPWHYVTFDIPARDAHRLQIDSQYLHIWSAPDNLTVGIPNRDQSVSFILIFRAGELLDDRTALARATKSLLEYYPELMSLQQLSLDSSKSAIRRFVESSLTRWSWNDRVVLVGDACHAMYPFCGLGLNTGLADVLELARALERTQSIREALRKYENHRQSAAENAKSLSRAQFDFLLNLSTPAKRFDVGLVAASQHNDSSIASPLYPRLTEI